jgi:RNA polymerase sigma-70 factor (ECF subfamily)
VTALRETIGMDVRSDATVIAGSLGQPEQFGVVFDRHARVVFRYLVRRVGPADADTALGEVFRVAFEKRATYDTSYQSARPWLYGIATRLVAKHRRAEARRIRATARVASERVTPADATERVDDRVDAAARWPSVADAVAGLPAGERDALLLFVWEELSYEEIAAALDVPVGTVRSRINRARRRLRTLREPDVPNGKVPARSGRIAP